MSAIINTFAALGDEVRFAIVERLLSEGELTAGEINQSFSISGPAISRHLKVLRSSGLVHQKVEGQKRVYSVRPESIKSIEVWSMSHQEFWENSLGRLEKIAGKNSD